MIILSRNRGDVPKWLSVFQESTEKVTGSNHSGLVIYELNFGLLVRILPSAFSLPALMYSALQEQVV